MKIYDQPMKRYDDDIEEYLNPSNIPFTKYRIIVPTEDDKLELMKASRHIHQSDVDTENIVINQLAHEYQEGDAKINRIIVDAELYNTLLK
jgi:hypothetical protein